VRSGTVGLHPPQLDGCPDLHRLCWGFGLGEVVMRALVRFFRCLPAALERAHLMWAVREIDPMHPDVGYIVHRLRILEDRCNA
jgi:hypothetical protein